jgi:hypothetical protein
MDTNGDGVLDTFVGPILGPICFEVTARTNRTIAMKAFATAVVGYVVVETAPDASALDLRGVLLLVPGRDPTPP